MFSLKHNASLGAPQSRTSSQGEKKKISLNNLYLLAPSSTKPDLDKVRASISGCSNLPHQNPFNSGTPQSRASHPALNPHTMQQSLWSLNQLVPILKPRPRISQLALQPPYIISIHSPLCSSSKHTHTYLPTRSMIRAP